MKKYISICIIISILLTGCSKKEINKPYEVIIGNNILSYYDTKDNITNDFNVLDLSVKNNQDTSSNNIIVNKDGKIRCISIIDNTIIVTTNTIIVIPFSFLIICIFFLPF